MFVVARSAGNRIGEGIRRPGFMALEIVGDRE